MPDSLSSRITSATMEMCNFWGCCAATMFRFLTRTLNKSPERVEIHENTCPGIVLVGTPMT